MNRLTAYGLSGLWLALVGFAGVQGCGNGGGGGETATAIVTCGAGTEQDGSVCTVSLDASVLCGPGTTFSGGVCVPTTTADATVPVTCGAGTMLSGTMCVPSSSSGEGGVACGPGTMLSGGACIPVPSDAAVITCGPGTVDEGGTCVVVPVEAGPFEAGPDAPICGAGTHECSGECYASDDGTHCGASCTACASSTPACVSGSCACTATSCPSGQACESGACVSAPCTAGNCNGGMCCNSACVVGATCCQASDCPAVNACQVSVACTNNQCVYTNQPEGTSCGGSSYCCGGGCTNVEGDKNNCGACGKVCFGGSPYAACINGYCGELLAQSSVTSDNGANQGQSSVDNPSLAIDASNVYFVNPKQGTVLQSPIATLGNTSPQVLFTNVNGSSTSPVEAIAIDSTRVYYLSTPTGVVGSVLIGGGSPIAYPMGSGLRLPGDPSLAIDAANLYTNVYMGFNSAVAYTAKTGGTFSSYYASDTIGGENLFDNVTYLFWQQCPGNNDCEITRYDVSTSSTAFLAMNQTQPTALTAGATNVYWAGQQSSTATAFIMASPIDGSTGPTTFENLQQYGDTDVPTMSVDTTGTLYWILGSNGGVLQKASTPGQVPETIMSNGQSVWGTPCFDANYVYYMMTDGTNDVQVWRSPK